ncbi:sensor histidine kinase [Taibaiella koreensis]|uniref:sensor histidine kinase n=1 Tax=Taibaiella koreensis TaxID=1268548 RepID=UPI000E59A3EA|nr:histidine kinase [Taibaiella koreensis]
MKARILILVMALLGLHACKQTTAPKAATLQALVDKKVWLFCDSIETEKINVIQNAPMLLHRLHALLPQFSLAKDSATRALIQCRLGDLYLSCRKKDSALAYGELALPYFEMHPDFKKPLFYCYKVLGITLAQLRDDIFRSNYYATKAAAICMAPGADTLLPLQERVQAISAAANTNTYCGYNGQSVKFARTAMRLVENHAGDLPSFYGRAIQAYIIALLLDNKPDSARTYLEREEKWIAQSHYTLQLNEFYTNKTSYFYIVKQYDSALLYALKTDWTVDPFQEAYTKLELYTLLKQPEAARANLDRATQLIAGNDPPMDMLRDFYHHKTRYDIWYGTRQGAENSFSMFDSLQMEVSNQERSRMAASLESEYNLGEKQKAIDNLRQADRQAKEEIRGKNLMLTITILGCLLCAFIIVALLLFSRQAKLRNLATLTRADRDKLALEQRLLRTQMEPHFIFNTMAAMQSLVYLNQNEKAIAYLNKFGRLLRGSIEHSREDYVPVAEEIEMLEDYVSLQAIQSDNSFDYVIRTYEGFEEDDTRIPPMLLQPFVENAILHGVRNLPYRGHVEIIIAKQEGVLDCLIRDNGSGLKGPGTGTRKSLSIQITRERLSALTRETGYPARLELIDNTATGLQGTTVHLVIPFI